MHHLECLMPVHPASGAIHVFFFGVTSWAMSIRKSPGFVVRTYSSYSRYNWDTSISHFKYLSFILWFHKTFTIDHFCSKKTWLHHVPSLWWIREILTEIAGSPCLPLPVVGHWQCQCCEWSSAAHHEQLGKPWYFGAPDPLPKGVGYSASMIS